MKSDIVNAVRASRTQEVDDLLKYKIKQLRDKGYEIEFGKIGIHTTYALLSNVNKDEEIVGYTYLQNMKYYKENVGKLKALQQAIARKETAKNKE